MIVAFTPSDYELLNSWWKDHGWTSPGLDMLPPTGFIVNNVCAAFLYKTDSPIAWMEFIISDKKADKDIKDKSLDILVDVIIEEAKKSNFKIVFTSSNHSNLISRLKKHNYVIGDENVTQLVRIV